MKKTDNINLKNRQSYNIMTILTLLSLRLLELDTKHKGKTGAEYHYQSH